MFENIKKKITNKNEKFLLEGATMAGVAKWLNFNRKKQTGNAFTNQDVQQYIRVGNIPEYLGGNIIETVESEYSTPRYNILKK